MRFLFLRSLTLALSGFALVAAAPAVKAPSRHKTAPAKPAPVAADVPWLYKNSDIPVDKQWIFGELPNGLRYVVRRNRVPPGQVSIRVAIDAGSLMERDTERGYAHFIEHLSFRGSKYVTDGEAKRVWQRLGATFGNDSNAITSPTQTIYKLDLPNAGFPALNESVKILSGMMSGPTISQAEVDAERRTVSAEAREQDGAQVRVADAASRLFYAGQPMADRSPIGNLDSLAKATSESLRGFHNRWYRPDNTVIAISGDGDPVVFAQLISRYFGDWKPATADPVPTVDLGKPAPTAPTTSYIAEPGLPTSVSLAWLRPWTQVDDTIALNQGRLIEIVASRLINRRLEQRARAGGSFLQADVEQENVARSADSTFVSIIPLGEDWRLALGDVRAVIADALVNPPTQSEIDREAGEFTSLLDVQVETARAEASAKQADDLIEAVNIRETVASPEVARDVFGGLKEKIKPADVLKATRRLFSGIGPRAFVSSQVAQADGAVQLAAAMAAPVKALATDRDQAPVTFDQLPKAGPAGTVQSKDRLKGIDVDVLTLSNGTKVMLSPSSSEAGRVYVAARFGSGMKSLPRDRMTPAWAGPGALIQSGIGTLKQDQIERMTSGRQITLSFDVGEGAYTMRALTRPTDLADQLKLMAAMFAAPGWDPAPVLRTRAAAVLGLRTADSSPRDVLARELGSYLHGGDRRWATPKKEDADALTPEAFRAFWEPVLATGPIELSIFGDFDPETLTPVLLETFGALPVRPVALPLKGSETAAGPTTTGAPVRLTHKGSPDQAVAVLAWSTGGGVGDVRTGRQLDMLAGIFTDRLFEQFREGEGASYSPDVSSNWPTSLNGGGSFAVMAQVKPEAVDAFFIRARAIASDLAKKPVSADELQRAVGPMLQRLARAQTGNMFWMSQLAGATGEPRRVTNLQNWTTDLQAITPATLQKLAKRYLKANKTFSMVIEPAAANAN